MLWSLLQLLLFPLGPTGFLLLISFLIHKDSCFFWSLMLVLFLLWSFYSCFFPSSTLIEASVKWVALLCFPGDYHFVIHSIKQLLFLLSEDASAFLFREQPTVTLVLYFLAVTDRSYVYLRHSFASFLPTHSLYNFSTFVNLFHCLPQELMAFVNVGMSSCTLICKDIYT